MNYEKNVLSIEERLRRAAQSRAQSPASAALKLSQISGIYPFEIVNNQYDADLLYELTSRYCEWTEENVKNYRNFCHTLRAVRGSGTIPPPYKPVWGTDACNALLLLAMAFIDRGKNKELTALKMTMEDYLEALIDTCYTADGKVDQTRADEYRELKKHMSEHYDIKKPLYAALAEIVHRYAEAWQLLEQYDHVVGCMNALYDYREREMLGVSGADAETAEEKLEKLEKWDKEYYGIPYDYDDETEWEQYDRVISCIDDETEEEQDGSDEDSYGYPLEDIRERVYEDPDSYFFGYALEYDFNMPDLANPYTRLPAKRLFLSDNDYSPAAVAGNHAESPTADFQKLMEECFHPEEITGAMKEVNACTEDLYSLLTEPFLEIEKYHYEKHFEN